MCLGFWKVPEATKVIQDALNEFRGTPEEVRVTMANCDLMLRRGDAAPALKLLRNIPRESPYFLKAKMAMADVAGLHGLKAWLNKRKALISDPGKAKEFGLSFPKGVLLLGVPGTGKSLCAKAVSQAWSLPLLKMDPAALYNKYIGQTEENFRRAIQVAEKMSPVILWIDEIEKAFQSQGGEQDGGVSTRVLGTFLGWLQEREGDVFVCSIIHQIF